MFIGKPGFAIGTGGTVPKAKEVIPASSDPFNSEQG